MAKQLLLLLLEVVTMKRNFIIKQGHWKSDIFQATEENVGEVAQKILEKNNRGSWDYDIMYAD